MVKSPAQRTRDLIDEVIWWHAILHDNPDTDPVTYEMVIGPSSVRYIVRARTDCMIRVKHLTRLSSNQIGKLFNRDGSTVRYATSPGYKERKIKQRIIAYRLKYGRERNLGLGNQTSCQLENSVAPSSPI